MKHFNFSASYTWLSWKVIAFSIICYFTILVDSHILVFRKPNQLIEEFNDLPALFGGNIPGNGLKANVVPAFPKQGCSNMTKAPTKDAKHVAIIQRGGENCSFELKVRNAQAANFDAVIVFNNVGDELEQMSATNTCGIHIPAVFVGLSTGQRLIINHEETFVVINDELPFNINTQLILPFTILIGMCFLIMIFYMIYKCVREERRLRQYRLPKSMLKKIPITKFTKNNDLSYDTCVICLEEFVEGDKLRILLCKHPYHSHCIDPWLTKNRRVCPVCKRKVFAKGEVRTSRNRQSSLDSGDTDDDTTPLLRPEDNSSSNHGTFSRNVATQSSSAGASASSVADDSQQMSDEENVLLTHPSQQQNSRRINPFDRAPNLPPNLADELNNTGRRSIWSLPIFRLFHQTPPISVSAQPIITSDMLNALGSSPTITQANASTRALNRQPINISSSLPSSNNILNPNLSGSFKDDDDMEAPNQCIYEPVAINPATFDENTQSKTKPQKSISTAVNLDDSDDSVFYETPTHDGIGVAVLPNPDSMIFPSVSGQNISSRSKSNRRNFLV